MTFDDYLSLHRMCGSASPAIASAPVIVADGSLRVEISCGWCGLESASVVMVKDLESIRHPGFKRTIARGRPAPWALAQIGRRAREN